MLDDGGYRRNSKDDEAEYAKNGSTIQTVGDEGFVDVEDANYDDNDSGIPGSGIFSPLIIAS